MGADQLIAFGQRLVVARGKSTQTEFGAWLGVHKNTLGRYEKGERVPDAAFLFKLVTHGGININWLMTGEGEMLVDAPGEAGAPGRTPTRLVTGDGVPRGFEIDDSGAVGNSLPGGFVRIPHYDVRAAAGRGAINETEDLLEWYAYREAWLLYDLRVDPSNLCIIDVVGNSMEPDIYGGDELMVDRSVRRFIGDGIYLVRFDGGLLVKQLQRVAGGMLRLVSRNPRYEPQTVNERASAMGGDFEVLGRVIGKPSFTRL